VSRATGLELAALASALSLVAGCGPETIIRHQIVSAPHAVGCTPADCGDPREQISVTYLGISGILVKHGEHVLLTAPFFSNPPLLDWRPGLLRWLIGRPIEPDTAVIERLLPSAADRASVILVGHGHYDHLLDVPYIATHRAKSAVIFGGPSIRHILMGDAELHASSSRLVSISRESAGDATRDGIWFYSPDSTFRFMAIVAGHAPTIKIQDWRYLFADATVSADLDTLPKMAADWKLGEPYAFLIDVLSDSPRRTIFRIYFEDAPSEPPLGFPSSRLLATGAVDLAILCAATSANVKATPDSLLRMLKPKGVMVTHWESFFRPATRPPRLSRATDMHLFVRSMRRSLEPRVGWVMPLPGQTVRFRPRDRS
jgi:L-ascorbate metabolism protein UlaG (beta-lactamase superfamily)